ncbi:MAG: HlyC/CorC family transporter [Actinobacteria bacterium]|nr:HlyC/CorC family transporter [Actinomycetota bacterium]MCB9390766.1 HlyC/CorC family transporter [Acidimicrobiia bacterium]
MNPVIGILAVVALILLNGYFVAAEFAFVAAHRSRLEDEAAEGNERAGRAVRVLKQLSFMLSGAQLGITVTSLVVGFIAEPTLGAALEPLMERIGVPEGSRAGVALSVGFVVATVAQMVIGELAPKNLAIARPESTSERTAGFMLIYLRLFRPLIRLFDNAANRLLKAGGVEPTEEVQGAVSAEEFEHIVEASAERGEMSQRHADIVVRVSRFRTLHARDVMVPWNRVDKLSSTLRCGQVAWSIKESTHSRLPIVDPRGRVVSVFHIKDVLNMTPRDANRPITKFDREPPVVPETATLSTVLETLQRNTTELALVSDEYGAPAGIVTLEDLVEELVGDISDEFDDETDAPSIDRVDEGTWRVPGQMRVDEVDEITDIALPNDDDYATIAGLVLSHLEHMPTVGESVDIGTDRLTVEAMDGWAITVVLLEANVNDIDDDQARVAEDET